MRPPLHSRPEPIALERWRDAPPEAVTFDYWDTLVCADGANSRRERKAAVASVLADAGVVVADDELEAALAAGGRRFDEQWHANRQYTGEEAGATLAANFGIDDRPTVEVVVTAYIRGGHGTSRRLTPGAGEALRTLHEAGVRLAIICDVGLTPSTVLRETLVHHDVLDLFSHWSFSDEVGVYKPDPVIFQHALDGLGVLDPSRAVHVGDLLRTDVAGALAMGMGAVRYAGVNDDAAVPVEGGPEAMAGDHAVLPDAVVHDHTTLPALLGVS